MKRDVVRDFLNLPGIVGIALMDGRSRPFFLGIDQILNFQQKEALSQGIQQVIETTPTHFEFFEFQFSDHRAFIYKLANDLILLVLVNNALVYANFAPTLALLQKELQEDLSSAIANFRLTAGNVTLSGQSYWKRDSGTSTGSSPQAQPSATSTSGQAASAPSTQPPLTNGHRPQATPQRPQPRRSSPSRPSSPSQPQAPSPTQQPSPSTSSQENSRRISSPSAKKTTDGVSNPVKTGNTADTASPIQEIALKDMLVALNQLSKTTTHYLGATIVSNYWKSSRPAIEWLSYFEVDRSGQITCSASMPPGTSQALTPEQLQWLREWVAAFIQKCSRVIRDFPSVIQKMDLKSNQRSLLLPDKR